MKFRNFITAFALLSAIIFCSCNENKSSGKEDTVVARTGLTGSVKGSAFYKRSVSYIIDNNGDTSDISFVFSESKEGDRIYIDLATCVVLHNSESSIADKMINTKS